MRLTPKFARAEFACKCGCGSDDIDLNLVRSLQILRDQIGKPIIITSGIRCVTRNAKVGGAKSSLHLTGRAADIKCPGMTTQELYEVAVKVPGLRGFGLGATFLHVDVRTAFSVWKYDKYGRAIAA